MAQADPSRTAPPEISVVMPAFNEEQVLALTVRDVALALAGEHFEIIIVDDGSRDQTFPALRALCAEQPAVRGLRFARNFGHMAALQAGLAAARGQAVITMDADGQHPPELLPTLIARWRAGAAVVQTLRGEEHTALAKRATSRWFYGLFSWLSDTRIPPGAADFRLLDRRVVDVALAYPRAALFLRGFVPWTGFETELVPFEPKARTAGVTKYSLGRMLQLARLGVMRFSVKPLRLATLLGSLTCAGAALYLAYVIGIRLFTSDFVAGWASVAGLLTFFSGVQLLMIGVLGEYVGMVFESQLGRPPYVIAERTWEAPGRPRSDQTP